MGLARDFVAEAGLFSFEPRGEYFLSALPLFHYASKYNEY